MSGGLAATQRWLQEALRFPGTTAPEEVTRRLLASPRLGAADGLAIYQRGYVLRIARCMREQFPALCHALDAGLFDDFVTEYLRDCPPRSHTLYDLGRRLPAWLDENRPDRDLPPGARESWIDFMVDLASFECAIFAMFDAPGHEGRPFASAATPDHRLRLQPAFALGAWRYPVAAYYHAVRRQESPALPAAAESYAALVRTDYVTRTIPLSASQHVFLAAMTAGGTAGDGLVAMARHRGTTREELGRRWHAPDGLRARWLDWGFFIDGDAGD